MKITTKNIINCQEFLTLPVSLIKGQKVHLLDSYNTTIKKIIIIALSTLCFTLTLSLSFFIGKSLTIANKNTKIPNLASLNFEKKQPPVLSAAKPNLASFPIWGKIIKKYNTCEIAEEEIQKELTLNQIAYQVIDLQLILGEYIKRGDVASVSTVLKIEQAFAAKHLSKDAHAKDIKYRFSTQDLATTLTTDFKDFDPAKPEEFLNYFFNPVNLLDEKNTLKFANIAHCIIKLIENLQFSDTELKNIFVKACCSSIYLKLINRMIELKGDDFFKDVYDKAIVQLSVACNKRIKDSINPSLVDQRLVSREVMITGTIYTRLFYLNTKFTNAFRGKDPLSTLEERFSSTSPNFLK